MERPEEVSDFRWLLSRPEVPPSRVTLRRVAEPIQWPDSVSDVLSNPDLQVSRRGKWRNSEALAHETLRWCHTFLIHTHEAL
jgi:hypothetical protein